MLWYVPVTVVLHCRVTGKMTSAISACGVSFILCFFWLQYTWNHSGVFLCCLEHLNDCIVWVGNGGMDNNAFQGSHELLKCLWSSCWFTTSNFGALACISSWLMRGLVGWALELGCVLVFRCLLSSDLFFEVFVLTRWPLLSRLLEAGSTYMISTSESVFSFSVVMSLSGSLLSLATVISVSGCVVSVCGSWWVSVVPSEVGGCLGSWLVSMVPSEVGGCLAWSEHGGIYSWVEWHSDIESKLHDTLLSGSASGWMTKIRGSRGSKE